MSALQAQAPSVPTELEADSWAGLEALAVAAVAVCKDDEMDWYMREHFPQFEPEDAAFIAAAGPATVLELIAAARSVGIAKR